MIRNLLQRGAIVLLTAALTVMTGNLFAHCDSWDGPVITDAKKALQTNDVTIVLKWIDPENEQEIIQLFNKTISLREGDKETYEIVEKHFLETLVRLHRESEGEPYTGLKPAGSASPMIVMADNALAEKDIHELLDKLENHIDRVIQEKYQKVASLDKVKNDNLEKGREYVKAYVDYTHTLEALHSIIEQGAGHHGH